VFLLAAIARLYAQPAMVLPSPVVELNRAVAVGMADGLAAGLAIADDLAARGELPGYHLLQRFAPTSCAASGARSVH